MHYGTRLQHNTTRLRYNLCKCHSKSVLILKAKKKYLNTSMCVLVASSLCKIKGRYFFCKAYEPQKDSTLSHLQLQDTEQNQSKNISSNNIELCIKILFLLRTRICAQVTVYSIERHRAAEKLLLPNPPCTYRKIGATFSKKGAYMNDLYILNGSMIRQSAFRTK